MTKIICVDCGKEEILSPGWEKLMADKPEVQAPKRCYACRQKKKAEKERGEKRSFGSDNDFGSERIW